MNISQLLFPENLYCISCDEPISRNNELSLCKYCYENINFLHDKNINYDKSVMSLLKTEYIFSIDIVTSYDGIMRRLIHGIKYGDKTYLAVYFAQMIYDYIKKKNMEFDYISSTPIHRKRLKQRGYNQVDLIAEYLSKLSNKEVVKIATRVKETKDMYTLHTIERANEMKDAFDSYYDYRLENKNLLIIDDILTTGSTAFNLSKTIKNNNKNVNIKFIFLSRTSLK